MHDGDLPLVIVGAGSCGAVIASRVSERSDRRVLLLEAGPDYPDPARLPRDLADGGRNSMLDHDWGLSHKPNSQQVRLRFPRGRVVGGSSAVNTCIALRGQPEDYDEWASCGLPRWSWQQCLPAFRRIERDLDFDDPWHGNEGPLPIRRHPEDEWVRWQAAFVESCMELGYPSCPDSNRPGSRGAGPHAMNKIDGRRISAAETFLRGEVRARDNLEIRADTLARRLLWSGRRVTGVEVERHGEVERIEAARVVVCAGATATPGLLLRSGVGPRADVERLGCEPVRDLPAVGARLLDHPGTAIFLRPRLLAPTDRHDPLIQTVLRYASSASSHTSDMLLQPGSKVNLPRVDVPLVSLMCSVGKPRGHGILRFHSADPRRRPIIESRLLDDDADRAKAVEAMQLAAELASQPAMRRLATHFWPRARTLRSRERSDAWIRSACDSGYHPCGTVPMGADDAPEAATDWSGRVRGVEGLMVGDASLMPTIPSANIHLAALMLAERIGGWLRDGEI